MSPLDGDLMYQYYAFALIDLLGQQAALRKIPPIPANSDEHEKFKRTVLDAIRGVSLVRDAFRDYVSKVQAAPTVPTDIPAELVAEYVATTKMRVRFHTFSDTIVMAVPYAAEDEHCQAMNGVRTVMVGACALPLASLADRRPLRGAIDLGSGINIEGDEVYGPVLARAHYIETELAEYPRIVVGEALMNFLESVAQNRPRTRAGDWARYCAERCRGLVIRDTDGRWMLDFMGPRIQEEIGAVIDDATIDRAVAFVREEYERFVVAEDEKLASRYYRLLHYMTSRRQQHSA